MAEKKFKNGCHYLLTSSKNFAKTPKIGKKVPFSQISITFGLDGIFTICFQFLKGKRELFNIFAWFWKILSKIVKNLVQILSVFDLSAFFLVDPLKWDWDLVTWQNLIQKRSSMPWCSVQKRTIIHSKVMANSIFLNLIGLSIGN